MLRFLRFVLLLLFSWYAMQAVHEFGHVLGAWATGGNVQRVVLHPLEISRTDVSPNPLPLTVAWAGPLVGVALPLAVAGLSWLTKWRFAWVVYFFAGFCLVANGTYIGAGSFQGVGDAGDLLRLGAPQWLLIVFGLISACGGLALWHLLTKRPKEAK